MDDAALKALLDGLEKSRGSLDSWLTAWTWVVVIGVALELVFAFHEHFEALALWRRGVIRAPERPSGAWFIFELFAISLVTIGIVGELRVEADLGSLETKIRDANGRRLFLLQQEAGSAKASSDSAAEAAARARTASDGAVTKANAADASAKSALTLADGARAEADSFKADIAAANKQADAAESHLADTLQRIVQEDAELERIKTPRSLNNPLALEEALKAFRGTEYRILGCFQDQESIDLLVQIDKVLSGAGWTRAKPTAEFPIGDIQLNITKDFPVPITTRSGIYVGIQSTETVDALNATPLQLRPTYIRAAMLLKGALATSVRPSEADLSTGLSADPGKSIDVFIIVGKKP